MGKTHSIICKHPSSKGFEEIPKTKNYSIKEYKRSFSSTYKETKTNSCMKDGYKSDVSSFPDNPYEFGYLKQLRELGIILEQANESSVTKENKQRLKRGMSSSQQSSCVNDNFQLNLDPDESIELRKRKASCSIEDSHTCNERNRFRENIFGKRKRMLVS